MTLHLEAVRFDVPDAPGAAAFWAALLGREVRTEADAALVPGSATQVGLRFVTSAVRHEARPHLHLHLTSRRLEDQQHAVATALRLGARHHDVGQSDDEPFVVMADPYGTEFCVIEPGNRYLAGTGVLGEVTGEGTRTVGLFWRDALGWPLVWDEGEQTAIQSPLGGTKIAWDAWDESPDAVDSGQRQRFELVSDDLDRDVDRLISLGARLLARRPDRVVLADPNGNEFELRSG